MNIELTPDEAREVREALLETGSKWSPVLDCVAKGIQAELDDLDRLASFGAPD